MSGGMEARRLTPARTLTRASLADATGELARRDPDLGRVVARLGAPPLWGRRPGYATLVRIILEQQVSLAAARTLFLRIRAALGEVTPETVGHRGAAGLRRLGLTRQKAGYCVELADRIRGGALDLGAIAAMNDADGRRALGEVPGLGPWSVDIYFLMALRRPDIWPLGDLALRASLARIKRCRTLPSPDRLERMAEAWRPWRSVAARIVWAHYLARPGAPAA